MVPLRYTRNLFLRAFCIVYLSAFLSFYIQIPGLYGDNGVLPAKAVLENSKHTTLSAKVHYQPTLLWLAPYLGLNTNYALDVLALLGAFLAFTGLVSQKFCTIPLFAGLWSLYFSLFQIGQTFVSTSYDEFLLEAGFLAILVAPLLPGRKKSSKGSPSDPITFWSVKLFLFRYLVTTGLSKYISGTKRWWDAEGYFYYFQNMPLPTPLSWYVYQLSERNLRYLQVFVSVVEIILPFFFFVPNRSMRLTSFAFQIILQIFIVLTGNFDFSNLLIVTLLLSLLDDQCFYGKKKVLYRTPMVEKILNVIAYACILGLVYMFFGLDRTDVGAYIQIDRAYFMKNMRHCFNITIYFCLISWGATTICTLWTYLFEDQSSENKHPGIVSILFYACAAFILLFAYRVPLGSLHPNINATVPSPYHTLYNRLHKLHVVNQYDQFSKIAFIDNRYEIVLEGSDSIDGPWKEYNFLYKPGNVNHSMPFVAPYSPKLDWHLSWAAYTTYDKHPWLVSLAHRLLVGKPEVLALLDKQHSPFTQKPPKYIRGTFYRYWYTSWEQRSQSTWWNRETVKDDVSLIYKSPTYFRPFSKDDSYLLDYLNSRNLLPTLSKQPVNPIWKQALDSIRYVTNHLEATLLFWSVLTAGLALICTSGSGKK